ncbi:hypothetical protein ACHAXN_002695 [Cyclotella atomus]
MAKKSSKKRDRKSSKKGSKKRTDPEDDQEVDEADNITHFKVEKIIASKETKNGTLYKVRWQGWGPADDTWEPIENVASTGHADRYVREVRARGLSIKTPGVAMIEYDDGERQLIDLKAEKFRAAMDGNDSDRDDDTVDGDPDVNDFSLIKIGGVIELLWPYVKIYFEAKVVNFCPLPPEEIVRDRVEFEGIASDENIVQKPAKVKKGKDRKKKKRSLEDSDEDAPRKKSKKESRRSKPKIEEDNESELDQKRKEKTRQKQKETDIELSDDDMEEEVLIAKSAKEKMSVSSKPEISKEKETEVATKQAADTSKVPAAYIPKKEASKVLAASIPTKETSKVPAASIPTKHKAPPNKTPPEASEVPTFIPKKPKPPPPPPAAAIYPKPASNKPTMKKAGSSPTKPKAPPPPLPSAASKPERRGKRDKRVKSSSASTDNEDEEVAPKTSSMIDTPSSSVDGDVRKNRNGKVEKSANGNTATGASSTSAHSSQKKFNYSVEDDEYLKSIQSTDEDNSSESNDEKQVSDTPPERIGQGVPLYNEPEDELSSNSSDYESDVSEEEIRQTAEGMDFERIWRMKLEERSSEILREKGITND